MAADKSHPEYQYLNLLKDVMENGHEKPIWGSDRTIKGVFGRQMRFNLSQGFPLLTTKKTFLRGIIIELLWFLRGDSNIKFLVDNNVHIWDEWAYKRFYKAQIQNPKSKIKNKKIMAQKEFITKIKEDAEFAKKWGELGPVYGRQWRRWTTSDGREIDQIAWAIKKLKKTPYRKHIVISAWNPEYIYEMAAPGKHMELPPCHTLYQIIIQNEKLHLQLYQRSCDLFLGIPFNIASYALLTMMFAHVLGYKPGDFVHTLGDAHLYSNHFDQARQQLTRTPRPFPTMKLNPAVKNIDDFTYEDFTLKNYNPHPPIKGEITVVGGF